MLAKPNMPMIMHLCRPRFCGKYHSNVDETKREMEMIALGRQMGQVNIRVRGRKESGECNKMETCSIHPP